MILNSSQLNKAKEKSSFDIHHDEFIGSSYMSYHKQKKQKTSKLEKISRNVNYDLVTPVEDMQFVEIAVGGHWARIANKRIDAYTTEDADKYKNRKPRTTIKRFSSSARRRMLIDMSQINMNKVDTASCLFITLTAPSSGWREIPGKRWKERLNNFLTQLRKKYSKSRLCGYWRMEFQERGAVHFHIITYNVSYIEHSWVSEKWSTICRENISDAEYIKHFQAGTEVQRAKNFDAIKDYFNKTLAYVAKEQEDIKVTEYDKGIFEYIQTFGKHWGRIGTVALKQLKSIMTFKFETESHFYSARRIFRNYIRGCKFKKRQEYINSNKSVPPSLTVQAVKKLTRIFSRKQSQTNQIMMDNSVLMRILKFVGLDIDKKQKIREQESDLKLHFSTI